MTKWKNIRICGTSSVLPNNRCWAALSAHGTPQFGDYGDWPTALRETMDEPLLWVMVLEDLIPWDQAALLASRSKEEIESLLQPLRVRLEASGTPTVVAWTAWQGESPIRSARQRTPWQHLARALDDFLYELAANFPNLYLLPLQEVLGEFGTASVYDTRNFYAASCRFSLKAMTRISEATSAVFARIQESAKKVLVLDCDNTLWGGVVGEVGVAQLLLGGEGNGRAFADFQRAVVALSRTGVVIALASKNNEEDVWEVVDRHSAMQLRREHISAHRINWNEKAVSLTELAEELNLGIDSLVFWDDNPLEREKVKAALPGVTVVECPEDVGQWAGLLWRQNWFAKFTSTEEDAKRVQQYQSRAKFVAELKVTSDEEAFLKSIDMRPALVPVDDASIARAEQLCAKTNQFNLRCARHSQADLRRLIGEASNEAFLMRIADRFGDHGITGLVIAQVHGEDAFIDSLLLSCRVFGRYLEDWMLHSLLLRLRAKGVTRLFAEFVPTAKNRVAGEFLSSVGFRPIDVARFEPALRARIGVNSIAGQLYTAELDAVRCRKLDAFRSIPLHENIPH